MRNIPFTVKRASTQLPFRIFTVRIITKQNFYDGNVFFYELDLIELKEAYREGMLGGKLKEIADDTCGNIHRKCFSVFNSVLRFRLIPDIVVQGYLCQSDRRLL